jgi:hypothetical protein
MTGCHRFGYIVIGRLVLTYRSTLLCRLKSAQLVHALARMHSEVLCTDPELEAAQNEGCIGS